VRGSDFIKLYRSFPKKEIEIIFFTLLIMTTYLPATPPESFEFPFGRCLAEDNPWVKMAIIIPWLEFEQEYALCFASEMGAPAQTFRMALGALIFK
jgi:hypothetical protein